MTSHMRNEKVKEPFHRYHMWYITLNRIEAGGRCALVYLFDSPPLTFIHSSQLHSKERANKTYSIRPRAAPNNNQRWEKINFGLSDWKPFFILTWSILQVAPTFISWRLSTDIIRNVPSSISRRRRRGSTFGTKTKSERHDRSLVRNNQRKMVS